MNLFTGIRNLFTRQSRKRLEQAISRQSRIIKRYSAARSETIDAASRARNGGNWQGIRSEEDALNKDYLENLVAVQQRAQDLDVNNPDVHGFHRTRDAQIVGSGVSFKFAAIPDEIGLTEQEAVDIGHRINRLREIHSRLGGFDASGNRRPEGIQHVRAMLTTLVTGSCLIHRVWRSDADSILPFSIELIPGSRISTPYSKLGDPLVSYGVAYEDDHRTRVTGYYVRRVSKTIGNSFVPDYEWDFVPVEDCSLLSIIEMAGLDRSMPLSLSLVRMLRNRGEFIEATVESARAQANHYAVIKGAAGSDPWAIAGDDADDVSTSNFGIPQGVTNLGDGVKALYTQHGEEVNWAAAKLPDPDFKGFMEVTDERCARGFGASLGIFTRKVINSFAGGRLEQQQDDPIIDQFRKAFVAAWGQVNAWFLESIWLTDAVELPGYSNATRAYWCEFRAGFFGKAHLNPVDSMKARETGLMLRSITPQQAAEEDGHDLRENLNQWAAFIKLRKEIEAANGLEDGELDILFSGKAITTSGGDEVAPPTPETAPAAGEDAKPPVKKNGHKINRMSELLGVGNG